MNNETLLLQQIDRQNDVIGFLQKENACFRQIIQTYLLGKLAATHSELALVKTLVENSHPHNAFGRESEGNSGSHLFPAHHREGMNGNRSFHRNSKEGNSESYNFHRGGDEGNCENQSFFSYSSKGNNKEYVTAVAARMRPFMKYSTQLSLVNTALILLHLHNDPATPLPHLRKLTGLSEDGMAKRIMALKKAALIVRQSAPLRYILTEKAKGLLEEKR